MWCVLMWSHLRIQGYVVCVDVVSPEDQGYVMCVDVFSPEDQGYVVGVAHVCACMIGMPECRISCDHVTVMCSWYDHTLLRLPTLGMDQALFIVVNNYSHPVEYSSVSSACYKV